MFYLSGVLTLVCLFALMRHNAQAAAGDPGVIGTAHDLSVYSTGGKSGHFSQYTYDTEQVCVFCHTPHGATEPIGPDTYIMNNPSAPSGSGSGAYQNESGSFLLWNRALSNAEDYGGYATYSSSTLDADGGRIAEVRVYSLLCLSCHDGVGALNVLTNAPHSMADSDSDGNPDPTGSGSPTRIGDLVALPGTIDPNIGERIPGSDSLYVELRNDHPISFDYTPSHPDAGAGLKTPGTNGFVSDANRKLRLFPNPHNGNLSSVECSTCHDPHQEGQEALGTYPFLVSSILGSQLCIDCHNK